MTSVGGVGLDLLFTPIQIGTMALANRIHSPTHGAGVGSLLGTEDDAERFSQYYWAKARGGAAWVGGSNCFVLNPVIPGFEPTGVGATTASNFRHPRFVERYSRYHEGLHRLGAYGTLQMIMMGGMPHGPSQVQSKPVQNDMPHELEPEEIRWFIAEYGWSAGEALKAGADGLELHANHDDLIQWFLSPMTNHRSDEYGGSVENRVRFLVEILAAMRAKVGKQLTLGVRLVIDEMLPGGYHAEDLREMMMHLEATGNVDYWSLAMGNNWGSPSYIQPLWYDLQPWASARSGGLKKTTAIPIVFTGRVTSAQAAEQILAAGQADVIGLNRATIADPELPNKAREGRFDEIRPCLGNDDCIHRTLVDRLPFGCASNPMAGHEAEGPHPRVDTPRKLLVIGGGPAGLELAAIAAERGHHVSLWERETELGGQMLIAARAPMHEVFRDHVLFQERRLDRLGVDVKLNFEASPEMVQRAGADAVIVATGAGPRRPDIPGVGLDNVVETRDVLMGRAQVGKRVLVVAQEDHAEPLAVADYLASRGHAVRLLYQTPEPAPLIGKYARGAILQRLFRNGVEFTLMQRAVRIEPDRVVTHNIYTEEELVLTGFDTAVLACGGKSETALYRALKGTVGELHILGDAYAPRRITFATRQAYALGRIL